jgi:linoleoyl-CoA desaturase
MSFQAIRFVNQHKEDTRFLSVLRTRVDSYFEEAHLSKKYNRAMVIKTFILLSIYILPFLMYLLMNPNWVLSLGLWIMMAFGISGIGMSIMHDANHGAYSSNRTINTLLGLTINLAGAFAFNWKIQHNILHHTYTNIADYDDDIDEKAILKLSPHSETKWYHRYQHIYAFFFYAIMTIYWAILKDFLQLIRYTREGHHSSSTAENLWLWIRLIALKVMYFFIILVVPSLYFGISFQKTLICFLTMQMIAGVLLTIVFQLAHTIEGTAHPLPTQDLIVENNWAIHQMHTTTNFTIKNPFLAWYVGGLNYQIEHHLFPNICHVHYPAIAEIVKNTAAEFHIPYLNYERLSEALRAHVHALKRFGTSPNLSTEIG